MEYITISNITNNGKRIDIDFSVSKGIERYFLPECHFFAEYDYDISDVPVSVAVVPLLANLLPFSWIVGCIIWVEEIDKAFYEMLPRLKNAFQEIYYNYSFKGSLIAAKQIDNSYCAENRAIQLFTGGVDATTTFYRIEEIEDVVLFNVNGWFAKDIVPNEVYDADKKAIGEFALLNRVTCHFGRSNFGNLIDGSKIDAKYYRKIGDDWWHGFQHSMAFLGAAAILGYALKANKIYIASSYTMGQEVLCASDPRTDSCFACASMTVIHDGYELSRQDKIAFLVKKQKALQKVMPLRVCIFNSTNCCACEKCYRTMLGIVAEGGDIHNFGFQLNGSLFDGVKEFLDTKIGSLNAHAISFWKGIIARMGKNYDILKEVDLYNYLKEYPIDRAYRKARIAHYIKHFWRLVWNRVKIHLSR